MRQDAISQILRSATLEKLAFEPLLELQRGLGLLGYRVRDIDGQFGPRTRNAWAEFQADCGDSPDGMVSPGHIAQLCGQVAKLEDLGGADLTTRKGAIAAIAAACQRHGIGLKNQIAYVLATVEHETNKTFMPVREGYFLGNKKAENFRRTLHYYPYYGRGYVQLTWKDNYVSYGTLLEGELVTNPDRALEPAISLFVLIHGFKTGAFTGRRIADFITDKHTDFVQARRCINGLDRAGDIAALAKDFARAL
jgi:predicted chitinase